MHVMPRTTTDKCRFFDPFFSGQPARNGGESDLSFGEHEKFAFGRKTS